MAPLRISSGSIELQVTDGPLALRLFRGGHGLVGPLVPWACSGAVHDRFVQLTEGVIAEEDLEPCGVPEATSIEAIDDGRVAIEGRFERGWPLRLEVSLRLGRVTFELDCGPDPLRAGLAWPAAGGERFSGLGARHGLVFDQSGRSVRLGADRRYTGPDCPPEMLELGGIPQGDYAPAPWAISSRGYAFWLETHGRGTRFDLGVRGPDGVPHEADESTVAVSARTPAGRFRLHLLIDRTPAGQLRRYCRLTGLPQLLPEWGYGHWKSRDVYAHQRDVEEDIEGYRRHRLPLDAIVIDSPWETQYNTWEFNPHQFPDPEGLIERMRSAGVRTVVWVTPWVNLDSNEGQRPPDAESERLHREPAPNYAEAAAAGHFVRGEDGEPLVARWWMGTGSPVDFTSRAAEQWWRALARGALDLGVEGIKADDGEAWYLPREVRFADGRRGADAAWAYGGLYRESMQRALDEATGGTGVLFARSGWWGQQAQGITWGGDQASDFWSLRALVAATLTAAASGFSNWSHDVGGYLGERLVSRCPKELLVRWLQFGCFTPLMHAHGRFEQEAWTYDEETLDLYRRYVLLHECLVPYVRAAAATAARCGLPVVRPLPLIDPGDPRGWTVADAYGYGPALWVAPVLDRGAEEREVPLPRGRWIDFWTGERREGGGSVQASAPLERIPVFVREGSLIVTYPEEEVASGLGDRSEAARPLEATLWGDPALGRAGARLADGTRVRWRHGRWSVDPERAVAVSRRP